MKHILIALLITCTLWGCSKLDQLPRESATKEAVFNNQGGLETYSLSFYNMLPKGSDIHSGDNMSDYFARTQVPDFLVPGNYNSRTTNGWNWVDLRNINYFLEGLNESILDPAMINHYRGLARFFRGWFYFEKVKRYGDVPWINRTILLNDPALKNKRDPRTLIIDSIIADLDFAAANITTTDITRSLITKYTAYGLISRVCLFEGTFRKYHLDYKLEGTANALLQKAVAAAEKVIGEGNFSVFNSAGSDKSYRQLFTDLKPISQEIMLSYVVDPAYGVFHDANWSLTSATYGSRLNFIRTFINTYLNIDGTPFTGNPAYRTMTFMQETKKRDMRLQQTIRTPGYKRLVSGTPKSAPPVFSYTYTGYQPIKFTQDDESLDGGTRNTNSLPIMRYAEILLNYAEAKAELGTLTDADWNMTVGALRRRAGITGNTGSKPVTIDTYLQQNYFPAIADASLLEIRRERSIELAMEGFRFYDLVRWNRGKLLEMPWTGFYVPALDTPMDLDEDGNNDVRFYITKPAGALPGVTDINVGPTISGGTNPQQLNNGSSGELTWLKNAKREFAEPKNYLYPIPETDLQQNPNLGQNPGWD
ncbi:RagB/SusD family nutrient uptake outer membrane protein [Niabella beijingensis]|uniref:RagB/SusD family nutrient uptake outer membrane protein n=1 Tax=Niabella beijingensis TaxID=2872700 RepID=UPI001CBAC874|nr:RagB/SusD family nutrient uptake outer membrane protein [Niabella beijingensis]MBZ4190134.1 RagB/SusD family nutrient uptake outer membrane protein [Niabella beijingensis]